VFYLAQPSEAIVLGELARARELHFNYGELGSTREGQPAPPGYVADRYGSELGSGEHVFELARSAIETFRMYPEPWTRVLSRAGVALDAEFVTQIHHLGFWSLNPCRILDVVDRREDDSACFGFAFGTLFGHAERGEERFEVRWERKSDAVGYRVTAFSRPAHLLAKVGFPIARAYQRRFQRESCEAMRRIARSQP
jgi:uncharacterized protein (UPF0548 family)